MEDYSSWAMKHPDKTQEIKKKSRPPSAAAAAGADWKPPWQPTTLKDLNRNGDIEKIERKIAKAKEKINDHKTMLLKGTQTRNESKSERKHETDDDDFVGYDNTQH